MSISVKVSTVLCPEHSCLCLSWSTHNVIITALRDIYEGTGYSLCDSVARVGEEYGDINLVGMPDEILVAIEQDLREKGTEDAHVASAIVETLEARYKFRQSLPRMTLVGALLRNRIRSQVESLCDGCFYDRNSYRRRAKKSIGPDLESLFSGMLERLPPQIEEGDQDMILRACIYADRII